MVAKIQEMSTLEKALRFLEGERFPLQLMSVVGQDEFSYDVIVPFLEEQRFLALGVT